MTILEYCVEEVSRQGHDVKDFLDGGRRVAWMMNGWEYAVVWSKQGEGRFPTIQDVEEIGRRVESFINIGGFRTSRVQVGLRECPLPYEVPGLLEKLWEDIEYQSPMDFYKRFEMIHPFRDGNGRTGKILLNWLNRTLLKDPIFPPDDLWGRKIRNP
jgi:hypothetical protein